MAGGRACHTGEVPALLTWWGLDVGDVAAAAPADTGAVARDLLSRLAEPHRRYHTSRHLVELFWALEELEEAGEVEARDAAVGRVAGWFHDAVYDVTGTRDSEAASAALAVRSLPLLGFGTEDVDRVRELVLGTARHDLPVGDPLGAAFHDADLWILSADAARFDEYCQQVRQEYPAVPDAGYAAARTAVLGGFARREWIYATDHARTEWGERARLNLTRELRRLSR